MRKFKVQYQQVFEYELEETDLDAAARNVMRQVQPDLTTGYIKVLSIEEIGTNRNDACNDCKVREWPESRLMAWPRKKVDKKAAAK